MKRKNKSNFTFNTAPTLHSPRSKFNLSHDLKTSISVGKLYPLACMEVLPGDTFDLNAVTVSNVSTAFLRPVMDNLFLDIYYFFVPSRIEYEKWGEIFGENNQSAWARTSKVSTPMTGGLVSPKTVADYMGLPPNVTFGSDQINLIPFRGFADIYNEWFRNENIVDPLHIQRGETNGEAFNNNPWSPSNYMGQLPRVAKRKDYFTACLPSPQKGEAVQFGLAAGNVPVVFPTSFGTSSGHALLPIIDPSSMSPYNTSLGRYNPHIVYASNGADLTNPVDLKTFLGVSGQTLYGDPTSSAVPSVGPLSMEMAVNLGQSDKPYVDLDTLPAVNVNDLRIAVQTQKLLERAARGGTRYREYLYAAWGVDNGDSRMQVPEYLGGKSIPLNIQRVVQNNAQNEDADGNVESPLGRLAGFSLTNGRSRFIKSFSEFGYLYCIGTIRQMHTYQQGVPKMFMRRDQLDYFDPLFRQIGEQPVYQSEIYVSGNVNDLRQNVFGYNEAWAEYRFAPNRVTGQMRSQAQDSFDIWHFADEYENAPSLTQSFIEETPEYVDRTLAAPSDSVDQFLIDMYFDIKAYRRLPVRSEPGYLDHF